MLRVDKLQVHGLSPVSFSVGRGECVALVGESGSGKTLLLRAIADLDEAEGRVFLQDRERASMPGPQWRKQVRYSAAEPGWWAETPREHFLLSTEPDKSVGQLGLKCSQLDQSISKLSTGERQRMALLRAMMDGPEVLLLDEPTGALDSRATRLAEKLIKNFVSASGTVLLVSHDPAQVKRLADHEFAIRDGKLVVIRK